MNTKTRCEGYRRYGGAFTFGPPRWEQCLNDATVMLTIEGENKPMPACPACWKECLKHGEQVILETKPI